jgi:hypothetical protein
MPVCCHAKDFRGFRADAVIARSLVLIVIIQRWRKQYCARLFQPREPRDIPFGSFG